MPPVDAPPFPFAADRLSALVAEAAADPRPPARLLARLRALDAEATAEAASLGAALFESIHYRLPAFPDDDLPLLASRLFARAGHEDAAFLLAGLAVQLRPRHESAEAELRLRQEARAAAPAPAHPELAAKAAAIAREPDPGPLLLRALEVLDTEAGLAASAALFEAVWPHVRPMAEYWVYYRVAKVYAALGRDAAAALLATLAIQIEPFDASSDVPYRLLLTYFRATGRPRDAAELCVRRHALCPAPRLASEDDLAGLRARAGPLLLSPPPAGRRDRPLLPSEIRPPRGWRGYGDGVPMCLLELQWQMVRIPIFVAELRDAEVLIDHGAVAVFGADGAPHTDLSLRCFPPVLRRSLAARADGPDAAEEIETEAAVLISDGHPFPNLCHFLLDHASRLELYRRAGLDIADLTVIGPELATEYQRVTADRLGVRGYVSVSRRARLRVNRLWVSSNCHTMRHPGHWAAEWAVRPLRAAFDLAPRAPRRRLLVSRRDSQWRRIRNEARVFNLLEPLGFEAIVPGALSFAEQIAAFRDATHIVAPHGAGLANILWCAPGTHVLEVFHPHYGTWAYAMLNDVLDIDYASMVGRDADSDAPEFNDPTLPREKTVPHSGRDILVDTDELERWLIDSEAL
jgi:hypothetical protein